jgi:hypothetical protein
MAPLYDFDWALNPKEITFVTITNATASLKHSEWSESCIRIAESTLSAKTRDEFKYRATKLLNGLYGIYEDFVESPSLKFMDVKKFKTQYGHSLN